MTAGLRRIATAAAPRGLPVARQGVRWVLGGLFGRGRPPFDLESRSGDPGLAGQDAVSWVLLAEQAAIAGGLRALLVQLLHPLAMAGVADHSAFREDPLGRLGRTSAYVTASSFGSTEEALRAAARVRGVHRRVRGTAPDGRPYAADDPHLLVWVSVALTSSFLAADALWAPRPCDQADRDRFVREQSSIAALLDPRIDLAPLLEDPAARAALRRGELPLPLVDDGSLPTDEGELRHTLDDFAGELEVGEQGLDALRFLRRPPLPASARVGYRSLLLGAIGSLDPAHRQLLGITMPTVAARVAVRQAGLLLTGLRLAAGPSPALDAARRRAAGGAPATT